MLCLILIVGGLLIMMGQHDRSEALFYYFRLEDQVPEHHLLRLIDTGCFTSCPSSPCSPAPSAARYCVVFPGARKIDTAQVDKCLVAQAVFPART
jgi:hypothetical protein